MIQLVKKIGDRYYLVELFKTRNSAGGFMFWWRYSGSSTVHQLSEKEYWEYDEGREVMGHVQK